MWYAASKWQRPGGSPNPCRRSTVADQFVEILLAAGVRRMYGVVGDSLNPVVDAIRHHDTTTASTGCICGTRRRERSPPARKPS
jgi:hypothetical protein